MKARWCRAAEVFSGWPVSAQVNICAAGCVGSFGGMVSAQRLYGWLSRKLWRAG